jgi:hypothetical protein
VTAATASRDRVAGRAAAALPSVLGVLFWFGLPVLCLVALGLGIDHLARHVNNVPAGIRGKYVVTSHSCQEHLCITAGTFTSTDGRIVEPNLLGDYRWKPGIDYGVVYNGNAAEVISLPAHWDPSATLVGMAGAISALALWGWCLRGAVRHRGLARAKPAAP